MTEKTAFHVTEKAGNFVAGRRSPGAGETLMLTDAEAHHALMLGELALPDQKVSTKTKPSKPSAADPAAASSGEEG